MVYWDLLAGHFTSFLFEWYLGILLNRKKEIHFYLRLFFVFVMPESL
jgi:hypothetical protein